MAESTTGVDTPEVIANIKKLQQILEVEVTAKNTGEGVEYNIAVPKEENTFGIANRLTKAIGNGVDADRNVLAQIFAASPVEGIRTSMERSVIDGDSITLAADKASQLITQITEAEKKAPGTLKEAFPQSMRMTKPEPAAAQNPETAIEANVRRMQEVLNVEVTAKETSKGVEYNIAVPKEENTFGIANRLTKAIGNGVDADRNVLAQIFAASPVEGILMTKGRSLVEGTNIVLSAEKSEQLIKQINEAERKVPGALKEVFPDSMQLDNKKPAPEKTSKIDVSSEDRALLAQMNMGSADRAQNQSPSNTEVSADPSRGRA